MMKQFLLNSPGCSGRGVRVQILSAQRKMDASAAAAAELAGGEVLLATFRNTEQFERVKAMIAYVTKEAGFKNALELSNSSVEWVKVDTGSLTMPGALNYETLFGAKDDEMLRALYSRLHDVTQKDVDEVFTAGTDVPPAATA